MKVIGLLIVALCACSSKSSGFTSNAARVKLEAGKVSKLDGTPYTGTLVAKDKEIAVVAKSLLGDAVPAVSDANLVGLVVVLPVKDGLVEGTGAVHVDLHADTLNPEVARRSEEALFLARAKLGSIKIAEATFTHGRLDGAATVWAPTGLGRRRRSRRRSSSITCSTARRPSTGPVSRRRSASSCSTTA